METAVVLGTFDGLHKGHRAVIEKAKGYYTVAVTFDIPPKAYFNNDVQLLMLSKDKIKGLKALGINEIYTLNFSEVADISAEEFFFDIKKTFSPSLIACGFNYRFGKGAKGDVEMLSRLCEENNIRLEVAKGVGEKEPISSSSLRMLIANGEVKKANEQIFGGFGFTSPVIKGDGRGKALGFPTANQVFPDMLIRPKYGVYKSKVIIENKEYDGITNIGVRPTYKTNYVGCETFIKNLSTEIYGKNMTLKLLDFIREERCFSDAEELKRAVKNDINTVLNM
ncbi:MAG: riboflavin biosynthesis protein RibF [Clostridia bacterium]|nr:riboflavin biosynthesis protein RibF [Clostridia bacterium]